MVGSEKFGSGEYKPTPSAILPAFINGEPRGFTCLTCGHLQIELDEFWDDVCPICLREWAKKNISKLVPTAYAVEQNSPLSPTVQMSNQTNRPSSDRTTVLMNLSDSTNVKKQLASDLSDDNDLFGD